MPSMIQRLVALGILLLSASSLAPAQRLEVSETLLSGVTYRNLGPFRAGAWLTDVAVPEEGRDHLYTFYIATRNGGVWKTTNNGTTFEPIFDDQDVSSIGAVALAPSNPNQLWVGTGEAYQARSSNSGDGIYKSTDAGRSFSHMGLRDSHHIAKIIVHPSDPNVVHVAAMGHLWTPNQERGVFKTSDGGRTWTKSLFINDRVGVIDMVMSRRESDVLYAAAYEVERKPWHLEEGGPGSAIYKTTDGGRNWKKLDGLPRSGKIGRIGLDIYQKNPAILYAIVENANARADTGRAIGGEVFRTDDGGATWRKTHGDDVNVGGKAPYSFNIIRINPGNPDHLVVTSDALPNSEDGGKTWSDLTYGGQRRMFRRMFGDVRNVWWDPQDPKRILLLSDGGLHISYDGGITADHYVNLPLGEVYAVGIDMENPYNIYAGLQDHESWKGPSNSWRGEIGLEDWETVGTGDGMYNQVDPIDSRWLYNTQEFGTPRRVDQRTRARKVITPPRPAEAAPLRFNWVTPLRLSPHDPKVIYVGAQMLFRSSDRGDTWTPISPDLTTNDTAKIALNGPSIRFCTISTLSESPVTPGVIWVGTDDGRVHVTRNGGAAWSDLTSAIAVAGGPADRWVSRVFASNFDAATAYVAKTGFRADDFTPYLFKTTDYGRTWTRISSTLPNKPINVVVEDVKNRNLLFVGNDRGAYVSFDGGTRWMPLRGNMPTVPVHDLVIHPRENDLIAGTYGRGVWVTDIGALREISTAMLDAPLHLFDIEPRMPRGEGAWANYRLYGDRHMRTANEPDAIRIDYYVREATEKAAVTIADASGAVVRTLDGPARGGINTISWNMMGNAAAAGGRGFADRPRLPPGDYTVTVTVGDATARKPARILGSNQ